MDVVSYQDIWEMLAKDWAATFSSEVVRRHTPEKETCLLECVTCGLHFFHPAVPGDEEFYAELTSGTRYEYIPWKWEFGWARDRIPKSAAVLDVGCGGGAFLLSLSGHCRRAVGLERNPSAREGATAKGLTVLGASIEEFAKENRETFDVVCAFHVVEHLPAPVPFLQELLACLRPGGTLFLSVPNRLRSSKALLEPLDCPPHHLTRWGPEPLRRLGDLLGAPLREIAFEPVENSVPREALREKVMRFTGNFPLGGNSPGVWIHRFLWRLLLPDTLCSLYRQWGVFERMGFFGTSMLGHFVRPGR